LRIVDFPEPEEPTIAILSPEEIYMFKSLSDYSSLLPYLNATFRKIMFPWISFLSSLEPLLIWA